LAAVRPDSLPQDTPPKSEVAEQGKPVAPPKLLPSQVGKHVKPKAPQPTPLPAAAELDPQPSPEASLSVQPPPFMQDGIDKAKTVKGAMDVVESRSAHFGTGGTPGGWRIMPGVLRVAESPSRPYRGPTPEEACRQEANKRPSGTTDGFGHRATNTHIRPITHLRGCGEFPRAQNHFVD
jgi:hypothetical protein